MALKEIFMTYDRWFVHYNFAKKNYGTSMSYWLYKERIFVNLIAPLMVIVVFLVILFVTYTAWLV